MKYVLNLLLIVFFLGCASKELERVVFIKQNENISYVNEIKPILDKRCVSCHSCYNAPCQLKLSSFEGLQRGASKINMYKTRLEAIEPTRLFIDAKNEKQWRKKGFYSLLNNDLDKSIFMQYLSQKKTNPLNIGSYDPEKDELKCVENQDELKDFFQDNPNHGMPYGMPKISDKEYNLIANWIKSGAINDQIIKTSAKEIEILKKYENFFNNTNVKNIMTARYIYEHLYLAHIKFKKIPNTFFSLVRSRTKNGEIDQIATRFVYSDPKEVFYYRFKKITSTTVHKTHMIYELNEKRFLKFQRLFINSKWDSIPYVQSYEEKISANPFIAYEQIPVKARYEFLLDNVHYFIMNFIRGPVCRGQIALNVINDHFWVMFIKPSYDLSVKNDFFIYGSLNDLELPNEKGANPSLLEATDYSNYDEKALNYLKSRSKHYNRFYKKGLGLDSIWKGNKNSNDAILTIYRHFNSSSIHKGALGDIPKTLWVIDYPLLERIYYSLVAGFDVFGNISHQALIRKYMDNLRVEGESNFLNYLPKNSRKEIFDSWYEGWLAQKFQDFPQTNINTKIIYKSKAYKKEFVNQVLDYVKIKRDKINFIKKTDSLEFPNVYKNKKDIEQAFKVLSLANASKFILQVDNHNTNLSYIRIRLNNKNLVYSIIINKWHKNVRFLFSEESRLDPSKNKLNFIEGFIGSYPNFFFDVKIEDFSDFISLIKDFKNDKRDNQRILKYGINRSDDRFWSTYDWFVNEFKRINPSEAGIFDLSRYYHKSLKR